MKLSKEEFATALKKGLGRSLIYTTNYKLDDVVDLVLEACLHNQSYDPQCELSRATWLFQMFADSPYYPQFRDAIFHHLSIEEDTWDAWQLSKLVKEMAAKGDIEAEITLRNYALDVARNYDTNDWLGADEWVELKGIDGIIELARIYGERLISDPSDRPYDLLFGNDEIGQKYRAILLQYARTETAIATYLAYLEEQGIFQTVDPEIAKQNRRQRIRDKYTLTKILNDAKNGVGEFPGYYVTFGRYALPEELETVYSCLLNESEDVVRTRLLWVFRRTPMPQLSDLLFSWAVGENEDLRKASIAALAQVSDLRVHNLARLKASNREILGVDNEVLDLFLHNYQDEDARLIMQALASLNLETEEDCHSLGYSLIKLAEKQDAAELSDALKWAYENTPCTNCRHRIVILLDRFQQLNETLLYECRYDANEDIRELAEQLRREA
jgi:hypothetical protein